MSEIITTSLEQSERWFHTSLNLLKPPISAIQVSVDMTQVLQEMENLRKKGQIITSTHILISVVGKVLKKNPRFQEIVTNNRRHRYTQVDIGVSVTSDSFVNPVLVVENPDKKTPIEISNEIARQLPLVHEKEALLKSNLKRWRWLVPFAFLRKIILKILFDNPSYRRRLVGSFQISTTTQEWALTNSFVSNAVLIAGRVIPKVVAVEGVPVIKPIMCLTLSCDHSVWNGSLAAQFLAQVKMGLEKIN